MAPVHLYQGLDALPATADAVFRHSGRHSLFYTRSWLENFAATIVAGENLRIYAWGLQDSPCALLPMQAGEHARNGRKPFAPRVLKGAENYYSSLFGPLLAEDAGAEAFDGLVRAINDGGESWDVLDFHPLDRESQGFKGLRDALMAAGYWTVPYYCFGNWYLEVSGRSFEAYFQSLPSQLKNTVKRRQKQFEASGRGRVEIISGGERLEQAIADYTTIYNSSWKKPEPYPEFVPGLMRTCAREGWLRLGVAYMDGEPAAAQIWIVHEKTASIYKLAYVEKFAKLSVGSILTAVLMKHVIDVDQVDVVDYLTGDDAYKKDWMSHRRERWGLIAYNPRTPRGFLAGLRHYAVHYGKHLKERVVRKLQPLAPVGS